MEFGPDAISSWVSLVLLFWYIYIFFGTSSVVLLVEENGRREDRKKNLDWEKVVRRIVDLEYCLVQEKHGRI
ncbi:hypothetical protein RIF29_15491 [Crotalaria pallida]|uniref:Transmembrane protein n=1 Tax=Crotalaria pallida TaxID=3830 RepID=A0AAN9IEP4_CROPI